MRSRIAAGIPVPVSLTVNSNVRAGCGAVVLRGELGIDLDLPHLEPELASVRHGVAGVHAEVEQHLVELRGVAVTKADLHRQRLRNCTVRGKVLPMKRSISSTSAAGWTGVFRPSAPLANTKSCCNHAGGAAGARLHRLHQLLLLGRHILAQEGDTGQQRHQRVVEIVRDAAGERADALEALGAPQPRIDQAALGDVGECAEESRRGAGGIALDHAAARLYPTPRACRGPLAELAEQRRPRVVQAGPHDGQQLWPVLRMHKLDPALVLERELLGAVAQPLDILGREGQQLRADRELDEALLGGGEGELQATFVLDQGVGRAFPFADVLVDADEVADALLLVADNHDVRADPHARAVGPQVAFLPGEEPAFAGQGLVPRHHVFRQFVGLADLCEPPADQIAGAAPQHLGKPGVDAQVAAIGAQEGDTDSLLVEERLQPRRAFAQFVLGALVAADLALELGVGLAQLLGAGLHALLEICIEHGQLGGPRRQSDTGRLLTMLGLLVELPQDQRHTDQSQEQGGASQQTDGGRVRPRPEQRKRIECREQAEGDDRRRRSCRCRAVAQLRHRLPRGTNPDFDDHRHSQRATCHAQAQVGEDLHAHHRGSIRSASGSPTSGRYSMCLCHQAVRPSAKSRRFSQPKR
jgi:hypothetical protein